MTPTTPVGTTSPEQTEAFGAAIAQVLRPDDVVLLDGDVGVGKSVLVRGMLRELGWSGPVLSPTFTLLNEYELDSTPLSRVVHGDLYRLDSGAELDGLGLDDAFDGATALVVEWGGVAPQIWGPNVLSVRLEYSGPYERTLTVSGIGRFAQGTDAAAVLEGWRH